MEITVEKIALIRENFNPKNKNLNLDVDWSVEYMNADQRNIKYDIVLRSVEYLNLNFKLEGLVILGDLDEFIQEEYSQIIFNHACTILMNIISLTRQTNYDLMPEEVNSTVNLGTAF